MSLDNSGGDDDDGGAESDDAGDDCVEDIDGNNEATFVAYTTDDDGMALICMTGTTACPPLARAMRSCGEHLKIPGP